MHSIKTRGFVLRIKRHAEDTAIDTAYIDILLRCKLHKGYTMHSDDSGWYRRGVIFPKAISNAELQTSPPKIWYCDEYYKLIVQAGDYEFKRVGRTIPNKSSLERDLGGYVE